MDKTTIYLPRELRAELREMASRLRLAQSEVMREALAVYLAQQEQAMPHTLGMGASDSVRDRTTRTS